MIKKTLFSWEEFRKSSAQFEGESKGDETISTEDFNKLVIKLIDHEREEFKTEGPEAGITSKELDQMHDFISKNGWYEKYNEKQVGQEMNEGWKNKHKTPKEKRGKWEGYTIAELKAKKKELMDKKSRTKKEQGIVDELDFAIRAKQPGKGKWGKIK